MEMVADGRVLGVLNLHGVLPQGNKICRRQDVFEILGSYEGEVLHVVSSAGPPLHSGQTLQTGPAKQQHLQPL
jgi:hypothetical protein